MSFLNWKPAVPKITLMDGHELCGKDRLMTENEKVISRFEQALVSLDRLEAKDILLAASDTWSPIQIVETIVVPALEHIGSGWEQGAIALSQVYMSGRICEELVEEILPENAPSRKHLGKTLHL